MHFSELLTALGVPSLKSLTNVHYSTLEECSIQNLFTIDRLGWLLNQPDIFKSLRLSMNHADLNPYDVNINNNIRLIQLLNHLSKGASCILHNAELRDYLLHKLCHDGEVLTGTPINCNIYLTPSGEKAFPPHTDPHDVIVVQIAGAKRWFIESTSQPVCTYDMHPGNILLVPRGVIHHAESLESQTPYSLHLTFGFFQPTLDDIVGELARQSQTSKNDLVYGTKPYKFDSIDFFSALDTESSILNKLSKIQSQLARDKDLIQRTMYKLRSDLIDSMKISFDGALGSVLQLRHKNGIDYCTKLKVTSNPFSLVEKNGATCIHTKYSNTIIPFPYRLVSSILSRPESFSIADLHSDNEKELLLIVCNLLLKRALLLLHP